MNEKPLCVDLFCGLGGWAEGFVAEGYRVVGFDNNPRFAAAYRAAGGEFVLADVQTLDGRRFRGARCIVASPPCQQFSRMANGFMRPTYEPDMKLIHECWRIRKEAGIPLLLENVEGARRWIGEPVTKRGSFYLWGDIPLLSPLRLRPKVGGYSKQKSRGRAWWEKPHARNPALRAKVPLSLARAVARGFL